MSEAQTNLIFKEKEYIEQYACNKPTYIMPNFDWLRRTINDIVGIRFWILNGDFLSFFVGLSYVSVDPDFREICVCDIFFNGTSYNPDISADKNWVNAEYVSSDNEWLLTVFTDGLDDRNLKSLLRFCIVLDQKDIKFL